MDTVEARAGEAGFGTLVARIPHPLGRIYATIAWGYFLMPALFLFGAVLVLLTGQNPWHTPGEWAVGLLSVGIVAGLAVVLAKRARGHTRRQAFYLYLEGYLLTSPFGRVVRVEPWQNVTRIEILPVLVSATVVVWSTRQRIICEFRHAKGRKVRFTEVVGKESLAPLALRLHAEAVQQP